MKFEWDAGKAVSNTVKHRITFEEATGFEIMTAIVTEDDRFDYGEQRFVAIGVLGARLVTVVYTERKGKVRLISVRTANRKEAELYVEILS